MILRTAWASLYARKSSVLLTITALCISFCLLFSVEHIRQQAKDSFYRSVSGVDLIVAARSSQMHVLLHSVFQIGHATNLVSLSRLEQLQQDERVAWAIPLSYGDSYQGFAVVGTQANFFEHFRYADKRALKFSEGQVFDDHQSMGAVFGAKVAQSLGVSLNNQLVVSHGSHKHSFTHHDEHPFEVVGILAPTGTAIDQSIYVSLDAIDEVHNNQTQGLSAILLGVSSKFSLLTLQRDINQASDEALSAIIPGVALAELWKMLSVIENILLVLAFLVLLASILGLAVLVLSSIHQRRNEFAVMRTIGASSAFIFALIQFEVLLLGLIALALSTILMMSVIWLMQDYLINHYGIQVSAQIITETNATIAAGIIIGLVVVACLPAWQATRK